jgi:RimJ/RimL family protein N-acetyltransferase
VTDTSAHSALGLRALQAGDCDRLLTWIDSADALWQWSGPRSFTWPLDRGQLLRDLAAKTDSGGLFAGVDETGEMVGHVLLEAQHDHGLGHIGRVAIAPDQRGRGLGTSLMRATIRHGFDDLALHRLQLTVYTFNASAIATYRSVGFVAEGLARESTRGSGGWWDGLTMSLLEPDFRRPAAYGEGIRIAGPRDADRIAALLTELGCPCDRDRASSQLLAWATDPHGEVLVSEAEGSVAGVAAVHRVPYFERPGAFTRVVALSVEPGHRHDGVRVRLLDAVTRWAADRGAPSVEITSPDGPGG